MSALQPLGVAAEGLAPRPAVDRANTRRPKRERRRSPWAWGREVNREPLFRSRAEWLFVCVEGLLRECADFLSVTIGGNAEKRNELAARIGAHLHDDGCPND